MRRIVLHAEGAGETLGSITHLPPVGAELHEEMLGPAHLLVRRAASETWAVEATDIRFDAPQRFKARVPRGSDLHSEQKLRQLLTWVFPIQQPDLAIVLVDADGDLQRGNRLRQA